MKLERFIFPILMAVPSEGARSAPLSSKISNVEKQFTGVTVTLGIQSFLERGQQCEDLYL